MAGPVGRREADEALVEGFVGWLEARGRSSYTRRTYGLGAAHFLRWLDERDIASGTVGRADVIDYVAEFRRGPAGGGARAARTVNHRVSVLAALFTFWAESDPRAWTGREVPVPPARPAMAGSHGMPGRDAPVRGRPGDLRVRVPRTVPRGVEPEVALALIERSRSWRDKALLTLLWRSGQRIGEWSEHHGRHGLLGLSLGDLDRRTSTIMVRLKGARDQHRVPVAEDFWPLFARYLGEERGLGEPGDPAWVALRKGHGRPLSYATFESQLRAIAARVGVRVNAHMFRHALAQALVDVAGLKVAQEVLGHAHVSTTAASYAPVDEAAMVSALARAADLASLAARRAGDAKEAGASGAGERFAFAYDADTARELDAQGATGRPRGERRDRFGPPPGEILRGRGPAERTRGLRRHASDAPGLPAPDARRGRVDDRAARRKRRRDAPGSLGGARTRPVAGLGLRPGAAGRSVDLGTGGADPLTRGPTGLDRPAAGASLPVARMAARGPRAARGVGRARRRGGAHRLGARCRGETPRRAAGPADLLAAGHRSLAEIEEEDLLAAPVGSGGIDVLDAILCDLGVLDRTPRRGSQRRMRGRRLSAQELVAGSRIPTRFQEAHRLYLETYERRVSDVYATIRHKHNALEHLWVFLAGRYPEVSGTTEVRREHLLAFIPHARDLARTVRRGSPGAGDEEERMPPHQWLIQVRCFFADICTWATEDGSPFAAFAPPAVPLERHDLRRQGFEKARRRQAKRQVAAVLDLEREVPGIRALALRRWEETVTEGKTGAPSAEADAFWDWALLELLMQSGLRIEEACELTTFDVLRRRQADGRLYYLLHVKPSKFDRARVIPIGDGLGRVIAQIIAHVRSFYGTERVPPCDHWDASEKRDRPRAPYLLQGVGHPSAIAMAAIRSRLARLSRAAGARRADGAPLVLRPHGCRRLFASELLNDNVPVHVIQALLGHAHIDTVMVYAKLYPGRLVEEYRKSVRAGYTDFHGPESLRSPTAEEWREFSADCNLRDMGTHLCALPTGDHCARGLVCLGCSHAQPKKSAEPIFRRMLESHRASLGRHKGRASPPGRSPPASSRSQGSREHCGGPAS